MESWLLDSGGNNHKVKAARNFYLLYFMVAPVDTFGMNTTASCRKDLDAAVACICFREMSSVCNVNSSPQ